MADRTPDVERMIYLRREAEKIVRELFQPEAAEGGVVRLVADLLTDGDEYVVQVEVPGVKAADLKVYGFQESVIVEGKKEVRPAKGSTRPAYDRAERAYGSFRRVFDWPGPADLSRTTASLRCGVLTIAVPRITDRRGRRPRAIRLTVEPAE
jgi:HSP20 family protein